MKRDKSVGPDGIQIEFFKDNETAQQFLINEIQTIWKRLDFPNNLAEGIMIMIYKKNDPNNFDNYRPLVMLNHIRKVLAAVIAKKIFALVKDKIRTEQCGFIPNRSCRDQYTLLSSVFNCCIRNSVEAVCTFIDYKEAFNYYPYCLII